MNPQPLTKDAIWVESSEYITINKHRLRAAVVVLKKEQATILLDIHPEIATRDILAILDAIDKAFPAFVDEKKEE